MKATIEIEATPQEMREFLGLPDVQAIQREAIVKIRNKMLVGIESSDMVELMKLYMPMPEQMLAMEGVQKTMWDAMMKTVELSTSTDKGKS
ncbi:DUF6489 family protein [Cycloclasticus pugetii]|uniref:DUF6489 family protein n=1 Tax=Cycloclasticus pugetii TaxID=34068 RepID=UPI00240A5E73|nr:DUF6489 family protein [Cycloclasticus pugetii]MDF1828509.1 DUF6489 family protein [Cycloclasticus pugetii]